MFNNRNGGSPKDYSQVSLDDFSSDDDDSRFGDEYGEGDFVKQSIRNQRVSIGCVQSFPFFLLQPTTITVSYQRQKFHSL
jgi:hypothetical protein